MDRRQELKNAPWYWLSGTATGCASCFGVLPSRRRPEPANARNFGSSGSAGSAADVDGPAASMGHQHTSLQHAFWLEGSFATHMHVFLDQVLHETAKQERDGQERGIGGNRTCCWRRGRRLRLPHRLDIVQWLCKVHLQASGIRFVSGRLQRLIGCHNRRPCSLLKCQTSDGVCAKRKLFKAQTACPPRSRCR